MSTSPTASLAADTFDKASAPSRQNSPAPRRLREPLLHFAILGGLLFAVDYYLVSKADDPRTIVVGAEVDKEAIDAFKNSGGRAPTAKELEALRRVWLDNEILYREGLQLEVDKGDTTIRDRVIFKALSVIDANVKLPTIDDKELHAWFDSHREKYDEPKRYDFEEAALSGDSSETAVRTFVRELNSGTPGDAQAGLRVFRGRPLANLEQSYGPDFAAELEKLQPGEWHAFKTRDGWRAMRLNVITPPKVADYEPLRNVAMMDWRDATASEQRSAAVRVLEKKYKVKYEGAAK